MYCTVQLLIVTVDPSSMTFIHALFKYHLFYFQVQSVLCQCPFASWPVVAFKPQRTFRKCCLFPALEIEIENKHFLGSPVLTDGVNHSGNSRERLCSAAGFAVICSIANVICYFRNGARKFKTLCVGSGEGAQI